MRKNRAPLSSAFFPTDAAFLRVVRRRRLAVLCGGRSAERAISLRSGRAVSAALRRLGLPHRTLDVTPGIAQDLRRHRIDLVFLATHGPFGEDGRLQGLLDVLGIPYTGSGVRASALAMHKPTAKTIFRSTGLSTPRWAVVRKGAPSDGVRLPPFPLVVKPASQGSALGVRVVHRAADLPAALRKSWAFEPEALVEAHAAGTEITIGILDGEALPVAEIVPRHAFYDFYSKYAPGGSRHVIPARLSAGAGRKARRLALAAHQALGCRHVSRVDIIVDRRGRPTLLEVNTLPGLTDTSLLPDAARAAGLPFDALVLRLLSLALRDAAPPGE